MTKLPCILIQRKLDGMLSRAERDTKKAKKLLSTANSQHEFARVGFYLVNAMLRLELIRLRCRKWVNE